MSAQSLVTPTTTTAPSIQVVDATKLYRVGGTDYPALIHANLLIPSGDFCAIVGPSGSGKTTLLNVMSGLDRPTSGNVYIDGVNLRAMSDGQRADLRKNKIGFIYQSFNLLARLTALENVEVPLLLVGGSANRRRERAFEVLKAVGLGQQWSKHPTELSGGEQQRVAIARALVRNPTMIMADEPTGNLDRKTTAAIMDIMSTLNNAYGTTFIMVTHNVEVWRRARRVISIIDGLIMEDMAICPRCGTKTVWASFCDHCGTTLPKFVAGAR